jgi:hypothetical protein
MSVQNYFFRLKMKSKGQMHYVYCDIGFPVIEVSSF